MEKYHFVRKINGTDETGIMDVESQKLICLCTEENSELLLKALRQPLVSGSDLVKTGWNIRECFKQLRFDKNHHLGLGDIRITIAQQDEICDLVERFYHCR